MATALHHTYHLFVPPGATRLAAGIWREHLAALRRSGLAAALDSLHVNVVGERIDIDPPACRHTVAHVASGHEMVTLQTVERLARGLADDGLVLYCHSKGVTYRPGTSAAARAASWRRAMLAHVVRGWRDDVSALVGGPHDAAGPFFLEADVWRPRIPDFGPYSYFAGNFWWATAAHLRRLPAVGLDVPRHDAEVWIARVPLRAFSRSRNVFPGLTATRRMRLLHAIHRCGFPLWPTR